MSQEQSATTTDDFVYIDLDEPTPWWSSLVGIIAVILITSVLVAPWVITWDDEPEAVASNALQNSGSMCRPNASGLPGVFDPTVASWSRFCEWFIAPELTPPNGP